MFIKKITFSQVLLRIKKKKTSKEFYMLDNQHYWLASYLISSSFGSDKQGSKITAQKVWT